MERQHYSIAERRSLTLARELLQSVFHAGNVEMLSTLAAGEPALHHPIPGAAHDRAGFSQMVRDFHAGFAGFDVIVDRMLAGDGAVAIRWRLEGQHTGPWLNVPSSGKPVSVSGMTYCEFDLEQNAVRLREHWLQFDALGLLDQIRA